MLSGSKTISLTDENSSDLEKVQKSAFRVILGDKYCGYRKALSILNLNTLNDRRKELYLSLAKILKNKKTQKMCPLNKNIHFKDHRNTEKCFVQYAHTGSIKDSSIICMQHLFNVNEDPNKTAILISNEFLCKLSCVVTLIRCMHYIT